MTAPTFLNADEVAALLRVNRKTVYEAAAAGTLPGIRVGRIWRFRRDVVLAMAGPGASPGPQP